MRLTTPALYIYPDGREICRNIPEGRREYDRRRTLMWNRQQKTCCLCFQPLRHAESTFEHENGRGGGKRDDRIVLPNGQWINGAAHALCNQAKGSRRVKYNQ